MLLPKDSQPSGTSVMYTWECRYTATFIIAMFYHCALQLYKNIEVPNT